MFALLSVVPALVIRGPKWAKMRSVANGAPERTYLEQKMYFMF